MDSGFLGRRFVNTPIKPNVKLSSLGSAFVPLLPNPDMYCCLMDKTIYKLSHAPQLAPFYAKKTGVWMMPTCKCQKINE